MSGRLRRFTAWMPAAAAAMATSGPVPAVQAAPAQPLPVELAVQSGESRRVVAIDASFDGRVMVTLNDAGLLRVWDPRSNLLLRTIAVSGGHDVRISRDGTLALVASETGVVTSWDLARGARLHQVATLAALSEKALRAVALDAGGEALLSADDGGAVRETDGRTGRVLRTIRPRGPAVTAVARSADGARAIVASEASFDVVDLRTGKIAMVGTRGASVAALSRDGARAALASGDAVEIWDMNALRPKRKLVLSPTLHKERVVDELDFDDAEASLAVLTRSRKRAGALGDLAEEIATELWSKDGTVPRRLQWWQAEHHIHRIQTAERLVGARLLVAGMADGALYTRAFDSRGEGALIAIAPADYTKLAPTSLVWMSPTSFVAETIPAAGRAYTSTLFWHWDLATLSPDAAAFSIGDSPVRRLDDRRVLTSSGRIVAASEPSRTTARAFTGDTTALAATRDGKLAVRIPAEWDESGVPLPPRWITMSEVAGGKERWKLPLEKEAREGPVAIAPDGAWIARTSGSDLVFMDGANGTVRTRAAAPHIEALSVNENGTRLAAVQLDMVSLWDPKSGAKVAAVSAPGVHTAAFDPRASSLYLGTERGEVLRFALANLAAKPVPVATHAGPVTAVAPSPDGRFLVSAGAGRLVHLTRADSDPPERLVSFTAGTNEERFDRAGEWLVFDAEGHFEASRHGDELAAAAQGLRGYRLEQLAPFLNRPDLLAKRAGVAAPDWIARMQARWQKRTKRLGITASDAKTAFGDAPVVQIASVEPAADRRDAVDVTIDFRAPGASLASYALWLDGVPLSGLAGKPLTGDTARVRERVAVTGRALLEVGARTTRGLESLRESREIVGGPPRDKPGKLVFLGFGVSRYRDARLNLTYAHKDVLDLAHILRAGRAAWEDVVLHTFTNEEATSAAVRDARRLVLAMKPEDTLIVFAAGHGTWSRDASPEYFYVTHDTDVKKLRDTAARFELFEDLLSATAARTKLFLIDTCESGERDAFDDRASESAGRSARGIRARTTRALSLEVSGAGPLAKTAAAAPAVEWDRYSENDLMRRTGAVVVSSSRAREVSYEFDALENGAFTEALLRATTTTDADKNGDKRLDLDELRAFVDRSVPELTGGRQHPAFDRENRRVRLALPIAPGLAFPRVPFEVPPEDDRGPKAAPAPLAVPPVSRGCACDVGAVEAPAGPVAVAVFAILLGAQGRRPIRMRRGRGGWRVRLL